MFLLTLRLHLLSSSLISFLAYFIPFFSTSFFSNLLSIYSLHLSFLIYLFLHSLHCSPLLSSQRSFPQHLLGDRLASLTQHLSRVLYYVYTAREAPGEHLIRAVKGRLSASSGGRHCRTHGRDAAALPRDGVLLPPFFWVSIN